MRMGYKHTKGNNSKNCKETEKQKTKQKWHERRKKKKGVEKQLSSQVLDS